MANAMQAAHGALWALAETAFADVGFRERNPAGYRKPAAKTDGLASYVAQEDDDTPETLAVLCGPLYDLKATPTIILALSGKTKAERQVAAYGLLETLKAALAADRSLSGAVDYADIAGVQPCEVAEDHWMAGGLQVQVGLLFTAETPAG